MNTVDIIFLILIGASVLYSLIRGLVREIFSLLSIIFGFLGASYGYSELARALGRWIPNGTLAQAVGFAALFIVIALVVGLAGRMLSSLIHRGGLGPADRMGGAAFGFLKAILLVAIIVLVLTAFFPPGSRVLLESKVSPVALTIARGLVIFIPERLQVLYDQKEKELKKSWAARKFSFEKRESESPKKP